FCGQESPCDWYCFQKIPTPDSIGYTCILLKQKHIIIWSRRVKVHQIKKCKNENKCSRDIKE
ncbi:expressed protein, partial [Batrachochytrium dendrobatidis JAM81]